jgi:hypothetical protein
MHAVLVLQNQTAALRSLMPNPDIIQKKAVDFEEPLQLKPFQMAVSDGRNQSDQIDIRHQSRFVPAQRESNDTGLPNELKSGIELLSGFSMDYVKVYYNSDKPAQLQPLAYAQGMHIHVGPGQEKHVPHEAWHVVQQQQGRVKPTKQMKKGITVNDDAGLEKEADVMGTRAVELGRNHIKKSPGAFDNDHVSIQSKVIDDVTGYDGFRDEHWLKEEKADNPATSSSALVQRQVWLFEEADKTENSRFFCSGTRWFLF